MTYNDVISSAVVAVHASSATVSLGLGGWQLWRRPRGDRLHRRVGRAWVGAMYLMLGTSFFVRPFHITRPDIFQLLAVFILITLTTGLLAAIRGNIARHRSFMTGTYVGVVGAFIGAVAVPQRDIPQLLLHRPLIFGLAAAGCATIVVAILWLCWTATPPRLRAERRNRIELAPHRQMEIAGRGLPDGGCPRRRRGRTVQRRVLAGFEGHDRPS